MGIEGATWVDFVQLAPHLTHPSDQCSSEILPLSSSSRGSVSSAKAGRSVNSTLPAMATAPDMEEANFSRSQVLGGGKVIFSLGVATSVMGQKELADVLPLRGPA